VRKSSSDPADQDHPKQPVSVEPFQFLHNRTYEFSMDYMLFCNRRLSYTHVFNNHLVTAFGPSAPGRGRFTSIRTSIKRMLHGKRCGSSTGQPSAMKKPTSSSTEGRLQLGSALAATRHCCQQCFLPEMFSSDLRGTVQRERLRTSILTIRPQRAILPRRPLLYVVSGDIRRSRRSLNQSLA